MKLFHTAFFVSILLAALGSHAAEPRQKTDYERKLTSVKALAQALKDDPKATTPAARSTLDQVGSRQKEAEEMAAIGEYDLARSLLDEGYDALTRTIAQIKGGSGYDGPSGSSASPAGADSKSLADTRKKNEYTRKLSSVESMIESAKRTKTGSSADITAIEGQVARAKAAAAQGDFDTATRLVDEAQAKEKTLFAGKGPGSVTSAPSAAESEKEARQRKIREFDSRMASARTMLPALKNQNTSKNAGREAVIADIESKLARAETLRESDPAAGLALIEEAYLAERSGFQSIQGSSSTMTGSAALESRDRDRSSGASDASRSVATQLKITKTLRDAYARRCVEKGIDGTATLARIDKLTADARAEEGRNPGKARLVADEAYLLAKTSLEAARAGR